MKGWLCLAFGAPLLFSQTAQQRQASGVYPHLAMFNTGRECGTGAVVPWAGKLWVITYSPHSPEGSDDRLYEIDAALRQTVRPESIGGTPANRMIHRESNQLFIGPYAIDASGKVRVIPYEKLYGRPTGNARHLTDPARKIYYATMEEGFYEVDVKTLEVTQIYEDGNRMVKRMAAADIGNPLLPGYHGKGLYSGQGRLVYANNGEPGGGKLPPDAVSGALAEWDGKQWTVVRRNQFCEVMGPGDLYGNPNPATDPIWSTGWDHRSLILMVRDRGRWHAYRLPKASHTYDGAHGWHTEWPRIRDIGEKDMLMTMHGMFWRFPKTFSAGNSAGIAPRSTYLRVIGDFAQWNGRLVIGSDDAALSEFSNVRKVKGNIPAVGQSQSNLWFIDPSKLDQLGAPIGRGGVWVNDSVKAGETSEPYLFSGFARRMLHLTHSSPSEATFVLEVDRKGNNQWTQLRKVTVPAKSYQYIIFNPEEAGVWVRLRAERDSDRVTAYFHYSNPDRRTAQADPMFAALAEAGDVEAGAGWVWARGENKRTLLLSTAGGLYEMDGELKMRRIEDSKLWRWMLDSFRPPKDALQVDAASVIYVDEEGKRWRLPKGDARLEKPGPLGPPRVAREVSTERDLFNAAGTFYELPANNSGGIAMVRPVATHNRRIQDYCSYRGMLVLSGVRRNAPASEHVVRSEDGGAAVWLGVSDDLWKLGKPRGEGGPWRDTQVKAGAPSDPYLMTGFDRKRLRLKQTGASQARVRVEVDITGTGLWREYRTFDLAAGKELEHAFPDGFDAYWVRTVADRDCTATAIFIYQ